MKIDWEARFYATLRRISIYSSPEWFERHSAKQYGLTPEEGIAMAYENVIGEAKAALAGYRRKRTNVGGSDHEPTTRGSSSSSPDFGVQETPDPPT